AQIFTDEVIIVTEIKERFMWVFDRKGATTHMPDYRICAIHYLVTQIFNPPTKIYLFHMGKKISVQSANAFPYFRLNEQSASGCPENLAIVVILIKILFYGVKYPSATKRIHQHI